MRIRAITLIALLLAVAFAAAESTTDSMGCWTCGPGWVHWYDLGWTSPTNGDKCECVESPTTAQTRANAPASSCWTCGPGWVHWYDLGWTSPSNGDRCQCVEKVSTTVPVKETAAPVETKTATKTPASTRNCWTCSPGYSHWYDLGMKEPADPCACIATSPTVVPTSPGSESTPSTSAPATNAPATNAPATDAPVTNAPATDAPATNAPATNAPATNAPATNAPADKTTTTTTTKAPATSAPATNAPVTSAPTSAPTDKATTTTTTKAPATSAPATSAPGTSRLSQFLTAMTPSASSTGSISFSCGIGSYSPSNPPPLSLVSTLMDNIITTTKYKALMTYYIDSYTIGLAADKGMKVLGIVYIVPGQDNTDLINTAITAAKTYPDTLISISCGNEMGANYGLVDSVVSAVSQCTTLLRNAGITQPIGVIDTYYAWCSHDEANCATAWSAIGQYVDWVGLNDYPFWDNVYSGVTPCNLPSQAAAITLAKHKKVKALYGKPVVITEFGWAAASSGSSISLPANYITGQQCAPANDENQKTMVQGMIDLYRENALPCNTFEAYREPWKGTSDVDVNRYWGICLGVSPYTCTNAPK